MIISLLGKLFGCTHERTTFPLTPSGRSGLSCGTRKGTYIVCLGCGEEFDYNWKEMRIGNLRERPSAPPATPQTEQMVAH